MFDFVAMKIHEYQAKRLLSQFGVAVPEGQIARNGAEAYEIARRLGGKVAVKAQVHAGGRGKGGGIKLAASPVEAEEAAESLIGSTLVTPQTGSEGTTVRFVLIEKRVDIKAEFYLGMIIDRSVRRVVLMASREGGVEIEEVAAKDPRAIIRESIDPALGLQSFQIRKTAFGLGLGSRKLSGFLNGLYEAFVSSDASLAEINPLVVTGDEEVIALDVKVNFDDNALFRHPEYSELRDFNEEEALEIQASRYGLSYVKLDGNVGCMVNGAGLAMATMDIIKLAGGNPANFLDVGGGASVEQVRNAFKILVSDGNVKAVLINIFGGIMRCDTVASGVVEAVRDVGVSFPVVVRLEGTNVDEGKKILRDSGLDFQVAEGMADAAEKVVVVTK